MRKLATQTRLESSENFRARPGIEPLILAWSAISLPLRCCPARPHLQVYYEAIHRCVNRCLSEIHFCFFKRCLRLRHLGVLATYFRTCRRASFFTNQSVFSYFFLAKQREALAFSRVPFAASNRAFNCVPNARPQQPRLSGVSLQPGTALDPSSRAPAHSRSAADATV